MEKVDLSGHHGGILELTSRAVFTPLGCAFGVEIVDGQGEEQKDEKEGDIALFFVRPCHRIPCAHTISKKRGDVND
jgi:hypothetical protein